jgi:adenylylsulfate kinase-like enzyme
MRAGLINNMTGIDSPYELPLQPEIIIDTSVLNIEESVEKILSTL